MIKTGASQHPLPNITINGKVWSGFLQRTGKWYSTTYLTDGITCTSSAESPEASTIGAKAMAERMTQPKKKVAASGCNQVDIG